MARKPRVQYPGAIYHAYKSVDKAESPYNFNTTRKSNLAFIALFCALPLVVLAGYAHFIAFVQPQLVLHPENAFVDSRLFTGDLDALLDEHSINDLIFIGLDGWVLGRIKPME
jgi:hypothetical protein